MPLSYATATASASTKSTNTKPAAETKIAPAVTQERPVLTKSSTPAPVKVAVTEPSICIPRVPKSFNDGTVLDVIAELGLGDVEKVDLIHKVDRNNVEYLMVFIHMNAWNMEGDGKEVRDQLMNNEKVKIVYDDPDYLFLSKSYTARPGTSGYKKRSPKTIRKTVADPTTYVDDAGDTWNVRPVHKRSTRADDRPPSPKEEQSRQKPRNGFAGLAYNDDSE